MSRLALTQQGEDEKMAEEYAYIIKLCIGSSCHLRGSEKISEQVQSYLTEHAEALQSLGKVDFRYDFCMGDCGNGVCMTVEKGDAILELRHITPDSIGQELDMLFGFEK